MIISKRKFNEAIERERNAVMREYDTDRRFNEQWNRINDLEKRVWVLEHRNEVNKDEVLKIDV